MKPDWGNKLSSQCAWLCTWASRNRFDCKRSFRACRRPERQDKTKYCNFIPQYIGLCCGGSSNYLREIAEEYGRTPASSAYAPDLSHSVVYVDNLTGHAKKVSDAMMGPTKYTKV